MDKHSSRQADIGMSVLVLGSLWGFSEVVLGAALRAAGLPYASAILTAIAFGLMAIAVARFERAWMLPPIAVVAVLCKQLVVPILHVSVLCKANSCLAVLVQGLTLAGTVAIGARALQRNTVARVAGAAGAALMSAAVFYGLGLRLAPCPYLLSFTSSGGLARFMRLEGVPWAVFSAVLFPAGYWMGSRLGQFSGVLLSRKPLTYYVANAAVIVFCWTTSAIAIGAGL